jgi:ribonuclease BN (tRNA processing enzyme)
VAQGRVQFLGTGTAFHTDGRGSQSIHLQPDSRAGVLLDIGPTAVAAMMRFGIRTDSIDRLFITHLHGDHTAGWPFLALHMRFMDHRARPFHVHGPLGLRDCLEGLLRLCYADIVDAAGLGFEVQYHELEVAAASDLSAGDLRFDALPMDHHASSLAYRLRVGDRRLAVTGDTRWCANLERLAQGTDLLIVECTSLEPYPHAHVSLAELRSKVGRLPSRQIVLIHLPDEVAVALAEDPIPRVTASYDGMELVL